MRPWVLGVGVIFLPAWSCAASLPAATADLATLNLETNTLRQRLRSQEITPEEFVALQDQWLKQNQASLILLRNADRRQEAERPQTTQVRPTPASTPEERQRANLETIRRSGLSPEEQIKRVDALMGSQSRPQQSRFLPAATRPRPSITDPDARAIQEILDRASRMTPEERIAEIDRQSVALEQHHNALRQKAKAEAATQTSIPTQP